MIDKEKEIIEELLALPTEDLFVTFIYKKKGGTIERKFEFEQFDSPPYYPRINRFYEFCIQTMKEFEFIDYHIKSTSKEIIKYHVDTDKEFIIH